MRFDRQTGNAQGWHATPITDLACQNPSGGIAGIWISKPISNVGMAPGERSRGQGIDEPSSGC